MFESVLAKCEFNKNCLQCRFFDFCKLDFCNYFKSLNYVWLKDTVFYKCKHKNDDKICFECPQKKECTVSRGLPYRKTAKKNVIINVFPDGDKIEVLYYKAGFDHLEDSENLEPVERGLMLQKNADGVYIPVSDDFIISGLQRSIRNANKRSLDSFYGFAKANDWEYFFTLTVSPKYADRYDDGEVKELWRSFQRFCARRSPDVKILCVPERHKRDKEHPRGALHFHGLMSKSRLDLVPAVDVRTGEPLFSKTGAPLLSIKNWRYGLNTLAVIPKEDNYEAVCNYIQKYVTKSGNIGYCQKRYYRTRNLLFKNKSIYYCSDGELADLVEQLNLVPFKDNDKLTVFRKRK